MNLTALALAASLAASPIFDFQTDGFWLNLHHFLYVLGRAEAWTRDASREAVRHAPEDAGRGAAALSADEQRIWRDAVAFYAAGPSRKDLVFDEPMPAITGALAAAGDAPALPRGAADAALVETLERAAPLYRKAWWPSHRRANRAWRGTVDALVEQHGATVLAFITKAFGQQWPANGFPVHLSAYSNWAGAYSTSGNLLVMSSLNADTQGLYGFETAFHEGMYQWDDALDAMLREASRRAGKPVAANLSHALIFFTAGEAVRRVVAGHTPYADYARVWDRGMSALRQPLIDAWKPYLDGRGSRADALAALVATTAP